MNSLGKTLPNSFLVGKTPEGCDYLEPDWECFPKRRSRDNYKHAFRKCSAVVLN